MAQELRAQHLVPGLDNFMVDEREKFRQVILKAVKQVQGLTQQVNDMQQRLRRVEKSGEPEPKLGQPASYIRRETSYRNG